MKIYRITTEEYDGCLGGAADGTSYRWFATKSKAIKFKKHFDDIYKKLKAAEREHHLSPDSFYGSDRSLADVWSDFRNEHGYHPIDEAFMEAFECETGRQGFCDFLNIHAVSQTSE